VIRERALALGLLWARDRANATFPRVNGTIAFAGDRIWPGQSDIEPAS
jgi:hypothetical protein